MKKRLITSALPYVNNVPHLGNLIQVLSADVFARFCRLRAYETCYVCGTDEYGTATETRAAEEGVSPRELCDRYWAVHNEIYSWFNISFDKFGRTSTEIQTEIVQEFFRRLDAAGFICEREIEQLYCPRCGRFLADRYVRGVCPACGSAGARGDQCENCGRLLDPVDLKSPECASCGAAPELRKTRHLYLDLPKLKDRLEAWLAGAEGRWARNAVRMTRAWLRDGLRERAITRDLKWGIPVPKAGYEDKVFYVWFDACIGYISITGNLLKERAEARAAGRGGADGTGGGGAGNDGRADGADWRRELDRWWKNPGEVELFQFIGKDNIPFHTVIFPASELGTGENWTMLDRLSSTEYLNYESGKFSKTRGVGVFGTDVMETGIPADVWRFYIMYNRPEKADALFVWKDFGEKVNAELIGNFANLVNRTVSFVRRYYDGRIPPAAAELEAESAAFRARVADFERRVTEKMEQAELREAFHTVFELSAFANKSFQDGEPWKKRTEDPPAAQTLIHNLSYVVRDLAVLSAPFIPEAALKIAGFFGLAAVPGWDVPGKYEGLSVVSGSEVLFSRLEAERIAALRERYSGTQKERERKDESGSGAAASEGAGGAGAAAALPPEVRFAALIELRVAKIVRIEKHPKADKLYIEQLDIGGEERTIVSGLVPYYKEEELLGKSIVVVYNLKEAKLRGVASRGMLLAASSGEADGRVTEVLDAGDAAPGTRVTAEGAAAGTDEHLPVIDIDTFFSVPLTVKDGVVNVNGAPLLAGGRPLRTLKVLHGTVG